MPRHPNVWTRAFALDSRAGFYRLYREELEARPLEELRSALAAGHGTDGVDGSSDSQPPRVLITGKCRASSRCGSLRSSNADTGN